MPPTPPKAPAGMVDKAKKAIQGILPESETLNKYFERPSMERETAKGLLALVREGIQLDTNRIRDSECGTAAEIFKKKKTDYAEAIINSIEFPKDDTKKDRPTKLVLPTKIVEEISNVLKNTAPTDTAIDTFKAEVDKLNKARQNPKFDQHAHARRIQELRHTMRAAIDAQHAKERNELERYLDSPEFKAAIPNTLSPEDVKKEMLKALEKQQHQQKESFDNKTSNDIKHLLEVTNQAEASALLCSIIEKQQHGENKAFLEQLAARRAKGKKGITITASNPNDPERFSDANIKEYFKDKPYITSTGKEFTLGADGRTIHGSSWILGFKDSDLLEMALLIKAMGETEIKFEISHDNPDTTIQLAQRAYEQCLKAGFPPDCIEVEYRGPDGKMQTYQPTDEQKKNVTSLLSSVDDLRRDNQALWKDLARKGRPVYEGVSPTPTSPVGGTPAGRR